MNWDQTTSTYLASADQWQGMGPFFDKRKVMQCQNFYSVVGGLGGFNILCHLNKPKTITLFDANIHMIPIVKLNLELILNCVSIDEYISLIYCRPFDQKQYNYENQHKFLQLPFENSYHNKLKQMLSAENFKTYNIYYYPYATNSHKKPTKHCAKLLPFHEAKLPTDPMVRPFSNHPDNVNTFYVGKGWLTNDESYRKVKFNLLNSNLSIIHQDISQYKPSTKHNGLYGSNIWSTDPSYSSWKDIIQYYDWIIGYDDYTDFEVTYYDPQTVPYDQVYGEGCNNPHESCCQAINNVLDLNKNRFLEVIEPHPSEGMNYGFRFYSQQIRISTNNFLKLEDSFDIIGIHILLGGGVDQQLWYDICTKAYKLSNQYMFIFEHRKECTDWETKEWDVSDENLLPERELDEHIFSLDYRWKKYGCANLKGQENDPRNVMYFLDKSQTGK